MEILWDCTKTWIISTSSTQSAGNSPNTLLVLLILCYNYYNQDLFFVTLFWPKRERQKRVLSISLKRWEGVSSWGILATTKQFIKTSGLNCIQVTKSSITSSQLIPTHILPRSINYPCFFIEYHNFSSISLILSGIFMNTTVVFSLITNYFAPTTQLIVLIFFLHFPCTIFLPFSPWQCVSHV